MPKTSEARRSTRTGSGPRSTPPEPRRGVSTCTGTPGRSSDGLGSAITSEACHRSGSRWGSSSRMPVSEPPITPPPMLLSRNSTRRRAVSPDGAMLRASPPCGPTCMRRRNVRPAPADGQPTTGECRVATMRPSRRATVNTKSKTSSLRQCATSARGKSSESSSKRSPASAGLEAGQESGLVDRLPAQARLEQVGARLVLGCRPRRAHAHGHQRHDGGLPGAHVPHDRGRADEAAEHDLVGALRRDHALGARAGALDQAATAQIGARDGARRVAEVEARDAPAVHLAHDQRIGPAPPQREGVLHFPHQHHLRRAPVERIGGGAEGAEDVNDDGEPARFPRPAQQAMAMYGRHDRRARCRHAVPGGWSRAR